jgi:hypothetical protein
MARALLVEAKMPKRYWFWALREAVIRMNLLPVRPAEPGKAEPDIQEFQEFPASDARRSTAPTPKARQASTVPLTTPFELFYGIKPDYRTLFQWGCIGFYRRIRDSSGDRGQFDMHSSVGIALGRSNHTNGMIFWDPVTQRMNVSADYKLDSTAAIGTHFPNVIYDGQISPMVLRGGKHSTKEPFPPGTEVQVRIDDEYYQGTIFSVPVGDALPNYQVTIPDTSDFTEVPLEDLSALDEPVFHMVPADSDETLTDSAPDVPTWITEGTQVTINHDGRHRRGALSSTDAGWIFQQRTARGRITYTLDLADLPITWKERISEGTLEQKRTMSLPLR